MSYSTQRHQVHMSTAASGSHRNSSLTQLEPQHRRRTTAATTSSRVRNHPRLVPKRSCSLHITFPVRSPLPRLHFLRNVSEANRAQSVSLRKRGECLAVTEDEVQIYAAGGWKDVGVELFLDSLQKPASAIRWCEFWGLW